VPRRARSRAGLRAGLVLPLLLITTGVITLAGPRSAAARPTTVVVASGDTLEAISDRYGLSLSALIEVNGLKDPGQLRVGQVLRLPPPGKVVVIRPGDTLEAIATRQGTTIQKLQAANPGIRPDQLSVGAWLNLEPARGRPRLQGTPSSARPRSGNGTQVSATPKESAEAASRQAPVVDEAPPAEAALLLSSAERRDRAELALREASGQVQWKRFGSTLVDWNGWRLHPGGVRITLVKTSASDLGRRRALATAVAVQCGTLRQTWRIDGAWEPWTQPQTYTVGQQILLDLCSNTVDGPAVPVSDAPPP